MSDDGEPFGSPGPLQGNPNYGDIRLAGLPLSTNELAITTPFDLFDSRSGDIIVNTQQAFSNGGVNGAYDLYTALLQESGHAFGLSNSTDPASVMYENYMNPRTGLSAGDVQNLQALYGARTPDAYEGLLGNNSFLTATPLALATTLTGLVNGVPAGGIQADLTTATDVDYYRVQANASGLAVQLRTSGVSLLEAQVTVYNGLLQPVATASASSPTAGDLLVNVPNARSGATYYVKVSAAQPGDVFGIGAYQIAAGSNAHAALFPPLTSLLNVDSNTNNTMLTATTLIPQVLQESARWDDVTRASISDSTDVDYYRIVAPLNTLVNGVITATPRDLVVTVDALQAGTLDPNVTVYGLLGQPMQADVLAYDHSNFTLQIANVSPLQVFYIRVAAANPGGPHSTGNYFLAADFRDWVITMDTFATDTLTQAQPQTAYSLQNQRSQLFHFVLSANTGTSTVAAAVRMSIYDAAGNLVQSFMATAGQTTSLDVMLAPETYTVVFTAGTQDPTQTLPPLTYLVRVIVRSDPIGPKTQDTTAAPAGSTSTTSTSSGSTDPSASSPAANTGSSATANGTVTDTSDSGSNTYSVQKVPPPAAPPKDPYSDPSSDPYSPS